MAETSSVSAPPLARRLLEARWPLEAAYFSIAGVPSGINDAGDGHPVLVLPGFTATDASTVPLRRVMRRRGHAVSGWRLGRNLGPTPSVVTGMRARLRDMADEHGSEVSLVGWSLGGIYARLLARENPGLVRQVITLGSPYRMTDGDRSAATPLYDRFRQLGFLRPDQLPFAEVPEHDRPPLTVPATSVYTREDGVVRWQTCIDECGTDAPNLRAENIEVRGSHSGLGYNVAAVYAVLDRLAQPAGEWSPFRPPPRWRGWFPQPASWAPRGDRRAA